MFKEKPLLAAIISTMGFVALTSAYTLIWGHFTLASAAFRGTFFFVFYYVFMLLWTRSRRNRRGGA